MAGRFPINKDSENFSRLSRLLIDGGTEALRIVFNRLHPSLSASLSLHKTTLYGLWKPPRGKKKILTDKQWDKLYPLSGSPNLKDFDITLLFVLLRNICPSLKPPPKGWDILPSNADNSLEADLVRIKFYRNELYGHVNAAAFKDVEFEDYWKKISLPLIALGISADEIDDLKTRPSGATDYVALLEEWKKADVDLLREIRDVGNVVVQSVSKEIQDLKQSVREEVIRPIHEVRQKLDDVTNKNLDEAETVKFAKQVEVVNRWRRCLIEEYTSKDASQMTPLPWLELEPHFSLEKMYKEPNITAKDGSKVEIRKLFESGPRRKTRRVLLEGNPGVGKTSFCKKLVNSWALLQNSEPCDSSFPEDIKVVLLLQCRDLVDISDWRDVIRHAIPDNYSEGDQEKIIRYIGDNEEHIAFVLDGYDELPSSSKGTLNMIINAKKVLKQCYVIVTSRMNQIPQELKNCFDRTLEIKGWDLSNAEQFIKDYFISSPEVAEQLSSLVFCGLPWVKVGHLHDLVCNPLHTAMICLAFDDNSELFTSQTSIDITTLYKDIFFCIGRRYKATKGLDVEECELESWMHEHLLLLGKYAYKALLEEKLCFTAKELPQFLADLGILFKNKATKKIRCTEVTFSFVHKSLQDYLAALFVANRLAEGDASVVVFDDVLEYDLASMIGPDRACVAVKCLAQILKVNELIYDSLIYLICECLHELKCGDQCIPDDVIDLLPQQIDIRPKRMSSKAVSGLCYWLSYRPTKDKVLRLPSASSRRDDAGGTQVNNISGITELRLWLYDSQKGLVEVLTGIKECVSIKTLELLGSKFEDIAEDIAAVNDALADLLSHNNVIERLVCKSENLIGGVINGLQHNKSVKILELTEFSVSDHSIMAFEKMLSSNTALDELEIQCKTPLGVAVIANAMAGNQAIRTLKLRYSPVYSYIEVKRDLGGLGRFHEHEVIKDMIPQKVKETLYLSGFRIDGDVMCDVLDAINKSTSLMRLSLYTPVTSDELLIKLAETIEQRTLIEKLELYINRSLTHNAWSHFAEALSTNNSIKALQLYINKFNPNCDLINKALKENTSIKKLKLFKITTSYVLADEFIAALARTQLHEPSLIDLDLSLNKISSKGAIAIAEMLSKNQLLETFRLSFNQIGDEGAIAIANALKTNSTLKILDLTKNNIGNEGAKAIAEALMTNSTLKEFDLCDTNIGDEGAIAIANALMTNSTLKKLYLHDYGIRAVGAAALADMLYYNTELKVCSNNDYIRDAVDKRRRQAAIDALEM
ncbi:protein NLRC3 isoform X1 [Nematostella vectensis]|uniref:protein NLRC3 isoform X1 n=1 Tax=Nematostella vectensis TaxID=45351 RepID=UPI0020776F4E|nr:protein NLRC3 isoform X1 [Nematostella vectensis]XP_048578872.1 protein NLRC3 isoform X1 [Nematostella vectensis]